MSIFYFSQIAKHTSSKSASLMSKECGLSTAVLPTLSSASKSNENLEETPTSTRTSCVSVNTSASLTTPQKLPTTTIALNISAADERRDISCDKPPSSSTPNTKLINNDNDKVSSVSITSVSLSSGNNNIQTTTVKLDKELQSVTGKDLQNNNYGRIENTNTVSLPVTRTNNKTSKFLPEEINKEERTTTNVFTPIPVSQKNLRQDVTKNGYNSGSPSSQEKPIKVAASLKNSYNKTINGNRKVQNDTNTYGNQHYKGPGYNVINFRNRKQSGNSNLYRSTSSIRLSGTARSTEDIFFASSKALQRTKSAYIRKVKLEYRTSIEYKH